MNKTQALAAARKLLGAKADIIVRQSVPVGEERQAEIERRSRAAVKLGLVKMAREARREQVLKADVEFQRLKSEAADLQKEVDNLHSDLHRRVTIVTSEGWCNRVEAEGDNFAEAVASLESKRVAA